jgi:lambda family phage portal protein
MRETSRKSDSFLRRASVALDDVIGVFSPRAAMMRRSYRFSYDILDKHRTRKKRSDAGGTGDWHLSAEKLDKLREICRDLGRNNPLVKGIFRKLATKIVGTATKVQARTEDKGWNQAAEELWKEEMVNVPCDVTGRFNIHAYLKKMYYSYCRDGDMFTVFADGGIQAIEGDQVGTPYGSREAKLYDVVNGVAVSKETKKVIGYFIGRPNKWGYIANETTQRYTADVVHHAFNSDRFSCSRGEPVLISAVDTIDKMFGYIDAELVAAKINACFPMMITAKDSSGHPKPFTGGVSSSGRDDDDRQLEKIEPGMILRNEPGETASAVGSTRPATAFDNFILRIMMIIGQPVNLPLMLMTGDYSGATFMNSRVAYSEARDTWHDEQDLVIKPFLRRLWILKVKHWIERKDLTERDDWARYEILCKRWPYVDPWKEAKADEQQLKNGTTNRTVIAARQGEDFKDLTDQRAEEEKYLRERGIVLVSEKKGKPAAAGTSYQAEKSSDTLFPIIKR